MVIKIQPSSEDVHATGKPDETTKRRTRVLATRQSSRGCQTCKVKSALAASASCCETRQKRSTKRASRSTSYVPYANSFVQTRRIKCDESVPVCLRCQRSKRHCAGYAYSGIQPTQDAQESSSVHHRPNEYERAPLISLPTQPAVIDLNLPPWQAAFGRLGCSIFAQDPHCLYSPDLCLFYSKLVPQFSNTIPFVAAAAASVGAAYDANILHKGDLWLTQRSEEIYTTALKSLQHEVGATSPRLVPILIAQVLLVVFGVVAGRRRDAWMHLKSVFFLFSPGADFREACIKEIYVAHGNEQFLDEVLRSLDRVATLSTWGNRRMLPIEPQPVNRKLRLRSLDDLVEHCPLILYDCFNFFSEILEEQRSNPSISTAPATVLRQGKLIACLNRWLTAYDDLVSTAGESSGSSALSLTSATRRLRHLLVLRAQCLGTLIPLSIMVPSSQMVYDDYLEQFTGIVECAEIVLAAQPEKSPTSPQKAFSPSLGLIQMLSYTARKCREPIVRRSAISLLLRVGIEGPFEGKREAVLAGRCVEIEEQRPFSLSEGAYEPSTLRLSGQPASHMHPVSMREIPDGDRICAVWRVDRQVTSSDAFASVVKFARRRKRRISWPTVGLKDPHGASPPTEQVDELEMWQDNIYTTEYPSIPIDQDKRDVLDSNNPALWCLLPFEAI